jgi:hypothetical protein
VKRARQIVVLLAPWAGLIVGLIAFGIVHQYGSEGSFDECHTVSPGPLLLVAIVGLLACGASGYVSWRTMRSADTRGVAAIISVGMAALFVFAILLAMIAVLVLPPCFQ